MQNLLIGKLYRFIFITGIVQRIDDFKLLTGHTEGRLIWLCFDLAPVTDIADLIVEALPLKDTHNGINRIGLVLLYFEIKFHQISPRLIRLSPASEPKGICETGSRNVHYNRCLSYPFRDGEF